MLISSYTKHLKRYDRDLYAGRTKDGALCVFRKHKSYELVCDEPFKLYNLVEKPQFVLALTDTWTLRGVPRQWGIDHVLNKIRQMDLQANERLIEEMDAHNERVDESERRKFRNEAEAFLIDNRREFAKAFDGVLTHSLSKDEPKRRLKDRSIKNGNY